MNGLPGTSLVRVVAAVVVAVSLGAVEARAGLVDWGAGLLKNWPGGDSQGGLAEAEIGAGLKEALRVATGEVVARLGAADGFNGDPAIHIPLPQQLAAVRPTLGKVGLSGSLDDLELKLNRAAEAATPEARAIFWQAITELSMEDVKAIYDGPQDAATAYFREKMSPALAERMRPLVADQLDSVGAVGVYERVAAKARALPFVPDVSLDLNTYVVDRALDGIFHYLAQEEAAIRSDPAKRTTELLQRVFGSP